MVEIMMQEAISLARMAFGKTLPNPRVGAVVFDESGRILGRGYHRSFGSAHAEVEAINEARKNGFDLKGASLCVTLEPCNHQGKTPPCTDAIINSGIRKVFIGAADDCKTVCGCGPEKLSESGIEVRCGILEEECRALNPGFHKFNKKGLPYVHLKAALSLNGKMTNRRTDNAWFTGEASRALVHEYRAFSDLIITGLGTIRNDDPRLNSRLKDAVIPCRVAILDPKLELFDRYCRKDLRVFKENSDVIIISEKHKRASELSAKGVRVIETETDSEGLFELRPLMEKLGSEHGFREIFVEAGPRLTTSFLKSGSELVDRITLFIAPVWFNKDEDQFFEDTEKAFPEIKITGVKLVENTVCIEGRL